jgi:hypothetical protein
MANSPHLFEDLKLTEMRRVEGIKQGLSIKGVGTFKFKVEDNNGKTHKIRVLNTLYLPELRRCLLSPQHWAQEAGDNYPLLRGTRMESDEQNCVLIWGQGKYKKTIPFNSNSNVPIMYSTSLSFAYCTFAATFETMEANFFCQEHVLQVPGLHHLQRDAPNKQEFNAKENLNFGRGEPRKVVSQDDKTIKTSNVTSPPEGAAEEEPNTSTHMGALTFGTSPPLEEDKEIQLAAVDDQAELMRWHYCLAHLSFAKLKLLARNGEIPCPLVKVPAPKCAGCLFGTMTRLPALARQGIEILSRGLCCNKARGVRQHQSHDINACGIFAQLKGKLTFKWYCAASVFVDHFSCLRYVHLMQDLSSEETVKAKQAFEQFAAKHGVAIKHYHCDNGRFADNSFQQACQQSCQQLTFCGVNAHFQNGIAECAIRDLSESARKQILHARQCWPAAVHTALWPYALRNAALLHNTLPTLEDGSSRLELFSSVRVGAKMAHNHAFGCPVFAVQNKLAAGNTFPKWSPRARLGLNLGPSPMHARNMYLVLNLSTGLVSPQYHCCFDDFFETIKYGGTDVTVSSTWQQLAGLDRATKVFPQSQIPILHSNVQIETPADTSFPTEQLNASVEHQNTSWEFHDDINGETTGVTTPQVEHSRNPGVPENALPSRQSWASHQHEGVTSIEPTVTAGTSQRGRVCKLSQIMAESVAQGMHHLSHQSTLNQIDEDLFHDTHPELQEQMRNPMAFHAQMMGDILYLQQALKQPDAKKFVQAVVKEVNGHVDCKNWTLKKRSKAPKDIQVVPSVWSMQCKRDLTTN